MLFTKKLAAEKRADFRKALQSGKLLQFPGAFNPLCAQMIERNGFDGVYISGAVMSADLCLPDIGISTMTDDILDRAESERFLNLVQRLPNLSAAEVLALNPVAPKGIW